MGIQALSENMQPLKALNSSASSALTTSKAQLNAGIVQSSIDLSIKTGNDALALLLKTAIEGVNEALQETHGENAVQKAYDAGIDVSPEATAERIVSISTGFFSLYQQQHPELNLEESVLAFTEVILGGIDQGFAEARKILDGLNVLEGDISSNIDKTYDLILKGLEDFTENY